MQKKQKKPKKKIRKIRVWMKTHDSAFTGFVYLPGGRQRFSDVLNDKRKFLSITDVESKDFASPKSFLAINKDLIEVVEILEPNEE